MSERELSERTVARDMERAAKFLGTLSRAPNIRRVVARETGYTAEDHKEGWRLYLEVMGYAAPAEEILEQPAQDIAIANLDRWDAPNFSRAQAALERAFPEQAERLFSGLSAKRGAAAVGSVKTFLGRVAELRQGSESDKAAAELLAKRRILDPEMEAQLQSWIKTATSGGVVVPPSEEDPEEDGLSAAFTESTIALHAWLSDWREQARQVITRRDYLIRLGLASPRRTAGNSGGSADEAADES